MNAGLDAGFGLGPGGSGIGTFNAGLLYGVGGAPQSAFQAPANTMAAASGRTAANDLWEAQRRAFQRPPARLPRRRRSTRTFRQTHSEPEPAKINFPGAAGFWSLTAATGGHPGGHARLSGQHAPVPEPPGGATWPAARHDRQPERIGRHPDPRRPLLASAFRPPPDRHATGGQPGLWLRGPECALRA